MIITPLWIQVNENFIFEHLAIHFAILMFFTEVSGAQLCTRDLFIGGNLPPSEKLAFVFNLSVLVQIKYINRYKIECYTE